LVTFAYYESLLGERRSEDPQIQLEGDILEEVLTFYRDAQTANVMPYWLTQLETDLQAWESYQDRQSTLALTWSSQYFSSDSPNTGLAPIPTREGKAFSYATGWVWCVVVSDLETELAAVELIEYLVEDNFLAAWTAESSYLPVRTTGFENWSEDAYPLVFQKILPSVILPPQHQNLNQLGPLVRDAVVAVLKDQSDPAQVTADLLDRLNGQE
jgi:ABC-type glycerol-3-phosphate transport system substrate-binding protein